MNTSDAIRNLRAGIEATREILQTRASGTIEQAAETAIATKRAQAAIVKLASTLLLQGDA